jgi:hypothetical protein
MPKEVSVGGSDLCPFSWIDTTEQPGCLGSLLGMKPRLVWTPQPCMKSQCKLWDSIQDDCGLITKKLETKSKDGKDYTENKTHEPLRIKETLKKMNGQEYPCPYCNNLVSSTMKSCPKCGKELYFQNSR